jgi:hypothetical protein
MSPSRKQAATPFREHAQSFGPEGKAESFTVIVAAAAGEDGAKRAGQKSVRQLGENACGPTRALQGAQQRCVRAARVWRVVGAVRARAARERRRSAWWLRLSENRRMGAAVPRRFWCAAQPDLQAHAPSDSTATAQTRFKGGAG